MKGFIKGFSTIFVVIAFLTAMALPAWSQALRGDFVQIELLASSPRSSTGTGSTISRMHNFKEAVIVLNLASRTGQAVDTIDVRVQSSPDGGTTYYDLGAFAQITGAAGQSQLMQWSSLTVTTAIRALSGISRNLAANTLQHGPAGPLWRVVWDVTNNSTGSWTFGLTGFFKR